MAKIPLLTFLFKGACCYLLFCSTAQHTGVTACERRAGCDKQEDIFYLVIYFLDEDPLY